MARVCVRQNSDAHDRPALSCSWCWVEMSKNGFVHLYSTTVRGRKLVLLDKVIIGGRVWHRDSSATFRLGASPAATIHGSSGVAP